MVSSIEEYVGAFSLARAKRASHVLLLDEGSGGRALYRYKKVGRREGGRRKGEFCMYTRLVFV